MLSYQHAYHAGNHADVLKHVVLSCVIEYFTRKEKPFYFHDTHAGRGLYALTLGEMQKTREYQLGIGKLLNALSKSSIPASLQSYLGGLARYNQLNSDGSVDLKVYPGSGLLAHALMRPTDRIFLSELHPREFAALQQHTARCKNIHTQQVDAWAGLRAALPPRERRGLVLIDPSYELKNERQQIRDAAQEACKRFPTGTYLIWYPLLEQKPIARTLLRDLQVLQQKKSWPKEFLQIEQSVAQKNSGMNGSGMLVINPPWTLEAQMQEILPLLSAAFSHNPETSDIQTKNFHLEKTVLATKDS